MKEVVYCRAESMCLTAGPTYLFFVAFLTCLWILTQAEDTQEVKAKPGDDVPLQCRGPKDATPKYLGWNRSDLKQHDYVLFYRDGRFHEKYQQESFHGRVEMKDKEMKDGDFSVSLKNVNINDTGRYECHVGFGGSPELISTITLTVVDSGGAAGQMGSGDTKDEGSKDGTNKDGGNTVNVTLGVAVALPLVAVLLVVVGVFVIYNKCKGSKGQNSNQLPANAENELQPL